MQQDPQPDQGDVPSEFPKKRRGRPPRRPNTTVKEEDYQENPLVQAWNSTKAARPTSVLLHQHPAGAHARVASARYAAADLWGPRAAAEIIYFVQGWITARHIAQPAA